MFISTDINSSKKKGMNWLFWEHKPSHIEKYLLLLRMLDEKEFLLDLKGSQDGIQFCDKMPIELLGNSSQNQKNSK